MSAITTTFDYSVLPAETAQSFRETATAILSIQRSAIADVGNHLIAAKAALEHGTFSAWAATELKLTVRSAERYMQAARFLEGKATSVSLLPPVIIYRLSSPSAPAEVVAEVVTAAENGTLSIAKIKKSLEGAAAAARAAKRLEERQAAERAMTPRQRRTRATREAESLRQKQEEAEQKNERVDRITPFVTRIVAALDGDDAADLLKVVSNWHELKVFMELLGAALKEREQPPAAAPPCAWQDLRDRCLLHDTSIALAEERWLAGLGMNSEPTAEMLARLDRIASRVGLRNATIGSGVTP